MQVKCNDYEVKEIVRFLRECSEKTQAQFAKDVGKQRNWTAKAESGVIRIYLNDFIELANKNNIEIIMRQKDKK